MISSRTLDKFKRLYQEKFDITLTDEEATKMATDLVNLMRVLLEPEPQETTNQTHEEGRQDEIITTHTH